MLHRALSSASVRTKILSVGIVGLIGTLVVAAAGVWALMSMSDVTDALDTAGKERRSAFIAQGLMLDTDGLQNAYILASVSGGPAAVAETAPARVAYLTSYNALAKAVDEIAVPTDPADQKALESFKKAVTDYQATDVKIIALLRQNTPASATEARRLAAQEATPIAQIGRESADAIVAMSQRKVEDAQGREATTKRAALTVMGVVFALVGAAIVALALVISRAILRAVSAVNATVAAMKSGDLTVPCAVASSDEVGRMAEAVEATRTSMCEVMSRVGSASTSVAAASEELTAVATQVSSTATESATQLGWVSGGAEEVSQNIQTVAAGAEEMTASIREISKSAADAAGVAADAVHVADRTNATVAKLGDSSAQIGEVVKAITSIAEQTNLLALNATIEAARAGEAGKGFAVVANEVKDLAQETSKATEDISRRVEAIQLDTQAAVSAIAEIASIIAQINDSQATIASAVEEQTATTNEMGRSVSLAADGSTQITDNVRSAARGAEESKVAASSVSQAAGELSTRAIELQGLIEQFRY